MESTRRLGSRPAIAEAGNAASSLQAVAHGARYFGAVFQWRKSRGSVEIHGGAVVSRRTTDPHWPSVCQLGEIRQAAGGELSCTEAKVAIISTSRLAGRMDDAPGQELVV